MKKMQVKVVAYYVKTIDVRNDPMFHEDEILIEEMENLISSGQIEFSHVGLIEKIEVA